LRLAVARHGQRARADMPLSGSRSRRGNGGVWVVCCHIKPRRPVLDTGLGFFASLPGKKKSRAPCQARGDEDGSGNNGVVCRSAEIFRERGKAAMPLSGSRISPAHGGRCAQCFRPFVIPAKAGTQGGMGCTAKPSAPARAGVTVRAATGLAC
jgi:hypothetical protein